MEFNSQDIQGGIEVSIGGDSADSVIYIEAGLLARMDSEARLRVASTQNTGANTVLVSQAGTIQFQQINGISSGTSIGIDIRADSGTVDIDTNFGGDIVIIGTSAMVFAVQGGITMDTVSAASATGGVDLEGGSYFLNGDQQFIYTTQGSQIYNSGSTTQLLSSEGDININSGAATAFTASSASTIAANQPNGDILMTALNGGSIKLTTGGAPVDLGENAHFVVPSRNTMIQPGQPCPVQFELSYVSFPKPQGIPQNSAFPGGQPIDLGQSPLVCVCDTTLVWKCATLVSAI